MNKNFNTSAELEQIKIEIANATNLQDHMKAVNKIAKGSEAKKTPRAALDKLIAMGIEESKAAVLLTGRGDFAGRIGYPAFKLTNNLASIKRWQEKADLLDKKATVEGLIGGNKIFEFSGGWVVYNFGVDRLQITFDAVPSEKLREDIRDNGFVWAPSEMAWQRPLTEISIWKAGRLVDVILPTLAALC